MIVTIAASPGAGKHDVARLVADRLGFRCVTIPDLRRSLARDRDVSEAELLGAGESEFWTDGQVDEHLEELASMYESIVVASRFGFRLVPHSFKILLSCDPLVTAQRLRESGDDRYGVEIDEIVGSIHERVDADRERGRKFYSVDPHDPSHFDLVLDISRLTSEQAAELLASALERLRDSWSDLPERI